MVGTINPIVYGTGKRGRWNRVIGIHVLGQVAAAMVMGTVVAGTGQLLHRLYPFGATSVLVALAIAGAIGTLHDLQLLPFRLPSREWQVPQRWKRLPPLVMALCYGLGIGAGIVTRIPFASLYFVLVACFASPNIAAGAGIMGIYGAARAMTLATVAGAQRHALDSHERLRALGRLAPLIGCGDGIALAMAAGFVASHLLRAQG